MFAGNFDFFGVVDMDFISDNHRLEVVKVHFESHSQYFAGKIVVVFFGGLGVNPVFKFENCVRRLEIREEFLKIFEVNLTCDRTVVEVNSYDSDFLLSESGKGQNMRVHG